MQRFLFLLLFTGLLILTFSREKQSSPVQLLPSYLEADRIFRQAAKLASLNSSDEAILDRADQLYQQALDLFRPLSEKIKGPGNDSLAFFIHIKSGYLEYYFDSASAAKKHYLEAIALKQKLPAIEDSFLFSPLLFLGGIYHTDNEFDSALSTYKKAERILGSYPRSLNESQRLYNRLGVMYYENGNYRLARNYFEQAISIQEATDPTNINLLANYRINIASLLIKLEEFEKARAAYLALLPFNIYNDEIYHNLGIISLKLKEYPEALSHLKQVRYVNNKKEIDLFYNLAMSYSALQEPDSANFYLHKAMAENLRWNGQKKNTSHGLILQYQGEELARRQQYREALDFFQQAIMQFDTYFTEADIYKNPSQYSGVFSYINLFNVLLAKAAAFEKLYRQEKLEKYLEACFSTYQSAYQLAGYVEKTYASDEARLFLGKIKHLAHSRPIEIGLELYELHQQQKRLEEVYFFDQQNKDTTLALNRQLHQLSATDSAAAGLLREETKLRSNITRLSLTSMNTTDSTQLARVNASIREQEIKLETVRESIHANPQWRQKSNTEHIPGIAQLQKELDPSSAIISYHLSQDKLLSLMITINRFEYRQVPIDAKFFENLEWFKKSLQGIGGSSRYEGAASAKQLYQLLLAPLVIKIPQVKRLMIIPDDELHYVPFEALQNEQHKFVIEEFAIQYQYSTSLLFQGDGPNPGNPRSLAFAPFVSGSYRDSTGTVFSNLPASGEEVNHLTGKVFADTIATKENFLKSATSSGIIHLATHARVDNEDPRRSFIAFYPGAGDYKLYAQEIYDMDLDSAELVILSACETGAGKLVKGEGLMSLSRAFAYAGCPDIITSLWKAEDKVTAFITQRLHHYLDRDYTRDKALQQAKLDLLESDKIDPRFKLPNYWANLLFIGTYEADHKKKNWSWVAVGIVLILLAFSLLKKKKPASTTQA